jgi:hypothetical protein
MLMRFSSFINYDKTRRINFNTNKARNGFQLLLLVGDTSERNDDDDDDDVIEITRDCITRKTNETRMKDIFQLHEADIYSIFDREDKLIRE